MEQTLKVGTILILVSNPIRSLWIQIKIVLKGLLSTRDSQSSPWLRHIEMSLNRLETKRRKTISKINLKELKNSSSISLKMFEQTLDFSNQMNQHSCQLENTSSPFHFWFAHSSSLWRPITKQVFLQTRRTWMKATVNTETWFKSYIHSSRMSMSWSSLVLAF